MVQESREGRKFLKKERRWRVWFSRETRGWRRISTVSVFTAVFFLCFPVSASPGFSSRPQEMVQETSSVGLEKLSETRQALPREILTYSEPVSDSELLTPPSQILMRDESSYQLVSWEVVESEEERTQYTEAPVFYEKLDAGISVPSEAEVSIEGTEVKRMMPLLSAEYQKERWERDFSCTLTFYSCKADIYELGELEIQIEHDSEKPQLDGYEEEILRLLGVSDQFYHITDYRWDGEAYRDAEGIWCRDAKAEGERKVRDCQAVYGGEVKLPEKKQYRTKAVYRVEENKTDVPLDSPAFYEEKVHPEEKNSPALDDVWGRISEVVITTLSITVGLGVILILLFLLRILIKAGRCIWQTLLSREKKIEHDTENHSD